MAAPPRVSLATPKSRRFARGSHLARTPRRARLGPFLFRTVVVGVGKLPDVPVRQGVLTAPHEVRRVLALRPDALTAQGRIFMEEIARWQKRVASAGGETGAVTFVQRFDSTLGWFVHFHVIVPDGLFFRADDAADGAVVFREGPAPTRADIADVAARVEKRMCRWLRRRGL